MKATLALGGSVLCLSITPILLKSFTPFLDSWTVNGIRYPVSALVFIPWLLWIKRKKGLPPGLWKLALIPTLINTAGQVLWAWTPYFLDPAMIGFVIRLSTVWAVIGAFIFFKDERGLLGSGRFWIGLLFALGGFAGLSLLGKGSLRGSTAVGLVLVFSCSFFWAGYQISVRRNLSHIPSTTAFGAVACMTSLPLLVCMMTFGQPEHALQLKFTRQALVIASGFLGISIGHVLFYMALKRLGVTICTVSNLMGAFLTSLLSRIVFGESLSFLQWAAGSMLVLGGILLLSAQNLLGPIQRPSPAQARLKAE